MFGFGRKERKGHTENIPWVPRYSTGGAQPSVVNNAKPVPVDTIPVVPDAATKAASFYYREGRDPQHQYSRVTTPLHLNVTFGSEFRQSFVPGARIDSEATLVVPRTQNAGMRPKAPRANQYRPNAVSYGEGSINPVTETLPGGVMRKWM